MLKLVCGISRFFIRKPLQMSRIIKCVWMMEKASCSNQFTRNEYYVSLHDVCVSGEVRLVSLCSVAALTVSMPAGMALLIGNCWTTYLRPAYVSSNGFLNDSTIQRKELLDNPTSSHCRTNRNSSSYTFLWENHVGLQMSDNGGEARTLDWLWLIKAVCRRCGHIRERMMLLSSTEMLFGHSHSLCFFTLFLLSLSFFLSFPPCLSPSRYLTLCSLLLLSLTILRSFLSHPSE